MSVTIENKAGETLVFKHRIGLDDLSKAMGHFDKAHKILTGQPAQYRDFTQWLQDAGIVEPKAEDKKAA